MNRDDLAAPELLPCPFCGGRAEVEKGRILWHFRILCQKCGAGTNWLGQVMDCPTHPVIRLSDRWNRRATPAAPPEVQAMIREAEARVAATALDIITSGAFDTSDPRIDALAQLAEAAALKGETT